MTNTLSSQGRRSLLLIGLMLFLGLLFSPVCGFDSVDYDDSMHIFSHGRILNPSWESVASFWKSPFFGHYIPVTNLFWSGLSVWFGPTPQTFHTFNLVLHLLNVGMVLFLLVGWLQTEGKSKENDLTVYYAAAGAAFFAVHPLQTEVVAWISSARDLLAAAFSFAALIVQWRWDKAHEKSFRPSLLATALFIAAVLSKPSAVALPAIVLVTNKAFLGRPFRESARQFVIWFGISAMIVLITKWQQPASRVIYPSLLRPLIALDAFAFDLRLLFFPWGLTIDYGRTPKWVLEHKAYLWTPLVPLLLAGGLYLARKRAWLWGGAAISLISVLPVSGMVPFEFQATSTVANRFLYFSLFGVAVAIAFLLQNVRSRWLIGLTAVVLVLLAVQTSLQLPLWQNAQTLFTHALEKNPNSVPAHASLAHYLYSRRRMPEAIEHLHQALRLEPQSADLLERLGASLIEQGKQTEAIEPLTKALAINPLSLVAHINIGVAYFQTGQTQRAIDSFRTALSFAPASRRIQEMLQEAEAK